MSISLPVRVESPIFLDQIFTRTLAELAHYRDSRSGSWVLSCGLSSLNYDENKNVKKTAFLAGFYTLNGRKQGLQVSKSSAVLKKNVYL